MAFGGKSVTEIVLYLCVRVSDTPVLILYLFNVGGPGKNPDEWLEFLRNLGTNPDRRPVEVRS